MSDIAYAPESASRDPVAWVGLSSAFVPLAKPVSDAKVLTGRQKPLDGVWVLIAQVEGESGCRGLGFSYALRAGGPAQFAYAREVAPELLGEDSSDVQRLWAKLVWRGASAGRSGLAMQVIAALDVALWDLKAKRASLPLAKLLGAHRDSVPVYNTSGGYLQAPIEDVIESAQRSLSRGIGGVKLKVGQPDCREDARRVETLRAALGDATPIMVDANQQWDRSTAARMGRILDGFGLEWIEEPLDAYDAEGHAALAAALDTPIGTGEMLGSAEEHARLAELEAADILMPDAPRIGGITPFLKVAGLAERSRLGLAPHFVMEIHIHLAAAFPRETWVEHFEWLEPLFEERLEIAGGRMKVPERPGLGLTLSDRVEAWKADSFEIGKRR